MRKIRLMTAVDYTNTFQSLGAECYQTHVEKPRATYQQQSTLGNYNSRLFCLGVLMIMSIVKTGIRGSFVSMPVRGLTLHVVHDSQCLLP